MRSANFDSIVVNGRRYTVDLLNPIDAISWGNRALGLFGPLLASVVTVADINKISSVADLAGADMGEAWATFGPIISSALASCGKLESASASQMMTEAIQQCYTPKNESLADVAVLNSHFREYPQDMFQLGVMALFRLVRDFFPKLPGTAAINFPEPAAAQG